LEVFVKLSAIDFGVTPVAEIRISPLDSPKVPEKLQIPEASVLQKQQTTFSAEAEMPLFFLS